MLKNVNPNLFQAELGISRKGGSAANVWVKRAQEFMCQMSVSGERTEKGKEKDKRLVPSVLGFSFNT